MYRGKSRYWSRYILSYFTCVCHNERATKDRIRQLPRQTGPCNTCPRVQRSSVGRSLACCKAGLRSMVGSGPEWGFSRLKYGGRRDGAWIFLCTVFIFSVMRGHWSIYEYRQSTQILRTRKTISKKHTGFGRIFWFTQGRKCPFF